MSNKPSLVESYIVPLDSNHVYASINELEKQGRIYNASQLPFALKIILESLMRNCDGVLIKEEDVFYIAGWGSRHMEAKDVPFKPARVILQDFTGVPLLADLAAMRSAVAKLNKDPNKINPQVPVDLVIDHSIQVDYYGTQDALLKNTRLEFERNQERYRFLHWGQNAIKGFRVVPPSSGIVHQVNLEYLAPGIQKSNYGLGKMIVFPDSVVGTDSHTTMINALGVLGWGVGGIEAEAVMLGQPYFMSLPKILGVEIMGEAKPGVTATDITLTLTQILRKKGVVDHIVEFFGDGIGGLSLADRATISNMAPEYGATASFFPVDNVTLNYLRKTGRPKEQVDLCERYHKEQGLFRASNEKGPSYAEKITFDLSTVDPSVAGPKRPQDRVALFHVKQSFKEALSAPVKERGFGLSESKNTLPAQGHQLGHGSVVIAAITSCTNTSNPALMVAAGLVAQKAVAHGLKVPNYTKTSLAPGSKVVTSYLQSSGLLNSLESLGFNLVGYGCTTCIGNSGPIEKNISDTIEKQELVVASVLSGNRNFEGRIHPIVRANYLASPPLVVAYALAGRVDIDLSSEPIAEGKNGPVFLKDLWPSNEEVSAILEQHVTSDIFTKNYLSIFEGDTQWKAIESTPSKLYPFDTESTYIQEPPFLSLTPKTPWAYQQIKQARVLCLLGDSVTTDHISPAGAISKNSPAGIYLTEKGVREKDFNSYGARRGNDQVMVRGTFANNRLKNLLLPGTEGGRTLHLPSLRELSIYDAAMEYKKDSVPLLVIAGKEYGTGSSRDWAAKGTFLLGVKAVLAESFERIHRSNLIGMGVMPLLFQPGDSVESLGITGHEKFSFSIPEDLLTRHEIGITMVRPDGRIHVFHVRCKVDSKTEIAYYKKGGILPYVLDKLIQDTPTA